MTYSDNVSTVLTFLVMSTTFLLSFTPTVSISSTSFSVMTFASVYQHVKEACVPRIAWRENLSSAVCGGISRIFSNSSKQPFSTILLVSSIARYLILLSPKRSVLPSCTRSHNLPGVTDHQGHPDPCCPVPNISQEKSRNAHKENDLTFNYFRLDLSEDNKASREEVDRCKKIPPSESELDLWIYS